MVMASYKTNNAFDGHGVSLLRMQDWSVMSFPVMMLNLSTPATNITPQSCHLSWKG